MSDPESQMPRDDQNADQTDVIPLKSENSARKETQKQLTQEDNEKSPPVLTVSSRQPEEDDTSTGLPKQLQTTSAGLGNAAIKKKDLIMPLFSRSNTATDKMVKPSAGNKTMIVETETVDASNVPSVTLPIGSIQNVVSNNDIMSNNSTLSNNISSLRSKKSTLFIDQNSQIASNNSNNMNPNIDENPGPTNANNPVNNNDAASVNGSIRGFNKRATQPESHISISSKPGVTKADLFAAKIANAVGDVSNSDSEETFVYESAPDALNTTNSAKVTTGNINNSSLALRKLSQRNISMPVASTSNAGSLHNTSKLSTIADNHSTLNLATATDNDESDSQISQQFHSPQSQQITSGKIEIAQPQALHDGSQTSISDQASNNHHKGPNVSNQQDRSALDVDSAIDFQTAPNLIKSKLDSNQTLSSLHQPKTRVFTKYNGDPRRRIASNASVLSKVKIQNPNNEANTNQLRTTTSKLFDVKGSALRRYSGVPDDVNIEDYIDQYDEEEEVGLEDYSDTYEFDDYEEDNELTPLNVTKANNNLKNKVSKNYFNRKSFPNFRSTDSNDAFQDPNFQGNRYKDEGFNQASNKNKSKKYRNRSEQTHRLQQPYSPHNFHNTKRNTKLQVFKNFMYLFSFVFLLLAFGFVAGFLLATTKDLQNVSITSLGDVVVSYDELVFDIFVEAFNPGFVSVTVENIELDVFAKTGSLESKGATEKIPIYLNDGDVDYANTVETILLGSVSSFEVPLVFSSGFFNRNHSLSKGSIKLVHPGQNATDPDEDEDHENHKMRDDSDKWRSIIKHPFDLILKGRLKYNLPFFRTKRSVAVTKTVSIDPAAKEFINHY